MQQEIKPFVSVVIPAYNEEKRIKRVLENYIGFMNSVYGQIYEIIVVCNGCTDDTLKIVEEIRNKSPQLNLLVFKNKVGKGGAIIEGFKVAKGTFSGFVDADESVSPPEFDKLLSVLKNSHADGVIGSRKIEGAIIPINQSFKRLVASKIFNLFVRTLFSLPFKDTQCSAKLFKKYAIDKLLSKITLRGYGFDVELLWKAKKYNFQIEEIPIKWMHSDEGKFYYLKDGFAMGRDLLKLRLKR